MKVQGRKFYDRNKESQLSTVLLWIICLFRILLVHDEEAGDLR
jgi:hypothetical protein